MKHLLLLFVVSFTFFNSSISQVIDIPDTNFLVALIDEGVDINDDGLIQVSEAEAQTSLVVSFKEIQSLNGIEAFINLIDLDCSWNNLTDLDLSSNVSLIELKCSRNKLITLNVSLNTALALLWCSWNELTALDVSSNTALTSLRCSWNKLTALDVRSNIELKDLFVESNNLSELDVSNNTKLAFLYCGQNQLSSLDVSGNVSLSGLSISRNNFDVIDVSNNHGLDSLTCDNNNLSNLDLSNNEELKFLNCSGNTLTELDFTNNTIFEMLHCFGNHLFSINLSNCPNFYSFSGGGNDESMVICANKQNIESITRDAPVQAVVTLFCGSQHHIKYNPIIQAGFDTSCLVAKRYFTQFDWSVVVDNDTIDQVNTDCFFLPLTASASIVILFESFDPVHLTIIDSVILLDSVELAMGSDSNQIYHDTICAFADSIYFEQYVDIPDPKFLATLLDLNVDVNEDGFIQVSEAEALTTLNIRNKGIDSLNGIEAFINLTDLFCDRNNLNELDVKSNTALTQLLCHRNNLSALDVRSNTALTRLYCNDNKLSELDLSFNTALTQLDCSNNNLSELDVSINTALTRLECSLNNLSELDVSINTALTRLNCSNNNLSELDVNSNTALSQLLCSNNNLSEFDVTFNIALTQLWCSNNNLSELDVRFNIALTQLFCSSNNLSELDVTFNIALTQLTCSNNNLSELDVSSNSALERLECSRNNLNGLDVSSNSVLNRLWCDYNNLSNLDLTNNTSLTDLRCNRNKLSELDVSVNTVLAEFWCYGNNLTFLDLSQNRELNSLLFNQNDQISFICANEENIALITEELEDKNLIETIVSLFCGYTDYIKYQPVLGISEDENCIANTFISDFPATVVFQNDTTDYLLNGCLYLPVSGSNLTFLPGSPDATLISVVDSVIILDSLTLAQGIDTNGVYHDTICVVADTLVYDLAATIIPIDVPRPGFDVDYKLIYENSGTISESGTIGLKFDSAVVTYLSADPMPDIVGSDSLTWNYLDLQPFEHREITFEFRLNSPMDNPPLIDQDIITYDLCILPIDEDYNPDDNCFILNQRVRNAYDPNDKTCLQGDIFAPDKIGDWLTYMIRFENTGSAEAVDIRVTDVIDTDVFDIKTLTPIDASHPFHVEFHNNDQVHFVFPEIYLPFDDANNDGYITFRIRTQDDLVLGDTIANQASIYFDFNFPIITNEAITEVKELNSSTLDQNARRIEFDIHPNPTSANVTISSPILVKQIDITTANGRLILRATMTQPSAELNLSLTGIIPGLYFIYIQTDDGIGVEKIIIE